MHLKLNPPNRRRLASLSALGAGALGVAACQANANDVVFSGVINVKVGPPPTSLTYTIPGPGPGVAGGVLKTQIYVCSDTCFALGLAVDMFSKPGKYGTRFRFLATGRDNSYALAEPQAAVWGTVPGRSTKSAVIIYTYDRLIATTFTATDRYLLFRFEGGALKHAIYGWARIQLPTPESAEIILVDWAYDPTGVHLPAGSHGGSGPDEPEDFIVAAPSAFDATGLPGLALGAPGLRRWRAARKAEAAHASGSTPAN